jgi:hypothetical protein
MPSVLAALVVAAALLSGPSAVAAPAETAPGGFSVEFQATPRPRGTLVEGYVHSAHAWATYRMVLRIERLDPSGRVLGASRTWVAGGTPSAGRAFFSARVAEAASYRVLVESFDWQRCGDG